MASALRKAPHFRALRNERFGSRNAYLRVKHERGHSIGYCVLRKRVQKY
jgi:hypothetical protein